MCLTDSNSHFDGKEISTFEIFDVVEYLVFTWRFVLAKCPVGQYSDTGLQPCLSCPWNHYADAEMSTSCTPCPQGQVTNTTGKTSPTDCQGKYISGSTESMETCHYIGYRGFFAYMFLFFTQHHLVKVSFCLDFSRIKIHASILQILHIIGQ